MNLILDQGNSRCKWAIFDPEGRMVGQETLTVLDTASMSRILDEYCPEAGLLSTVRPVGSEVVDLLNRRLEAFVEAGPDTRLPIGNAYATPSTLGFDRLAAAVGAWMQQPRHPLLVVDMGTAITYDLVSEDGVFRGGNIAPGLRTRLRSLHEYTGRLPWVEPTTDFDLLGKDTESAIRSGVMQGILFEVDAYIDALRELHPGLLAFLTGGDLNYFDGKFKNGIFADANLVLKGLNRILQHHVHP